MSDPQYQNDIDSLPRLSQYNFENLLKVCFDDETGSYYYNLSNSIFFPDELSLDVYFDYQVPGNGMSWNYLSYIHYGTIKLWWLLCAVNNVDNPMLFPAPGSVIKILRPTVLREILQQIQQSK